MLEDNSDLLYRFPYCTVMITMVIVALIPSRLTVLELYDLSRLFYYLQLRHSFFCEAVFVLIPQPQQLT